MGRKAQNLPATNVARQESLRDDLPAVSRSSKRVEDSLLPQLFDEPPPRIGELRPVRLPDKFNLQIKHNSGFSWIGITSTGHWKKSSSSKTHCDLTIDLDVHAQPENGRFKQFSFTILIKLDDVEGEQCHVDLQPNM